MKITNEQLRQIIKEELEAVLSEAPTAGRGETTGLSGRTGYAPSDKVIRQKQDKEQDDEETSAAQAQSAQAFDNEKVEKELERKRRGAPTFVKNAIRNNDKRLENKTISEIIQNISSDSPLSNQRDKQQFFQTLWDLYGMTRIGFNNLIELTAIEVMTPMTQRAGKPVDFEKTGDLSASLLEDIANATWLKIRNMEPKKKEKKSLMKKVGGFFGFEQ